MKVVNNTSFPIIAFGVCNEIGYGEDVKISPSESASVNGPYAGEMGGGDCHVYLEGEIVCQETADDENGFRVLQGSQLCLGAEGKGITVRHHLDKAEAHVLEWRQLNKDVN